MADIFLSYSRKDRTIAESLAEILRSAHGWTLYWDRQLLAGEVFDDVLEREIAAARCVVVHVVVQLRIALLSMGKERGR